MKIEYSERLQKLPPYLFAEIDRVKREMIGKGKKLIDLGVGDPDTPTPTHIIQANYRGARDPKSHQYALDFGMKELRDAIAAWYGRRFSVSLDPETEVLPLLGSKEGIAHVPLAFVNPGDRVLVPNPGYPVYQSGTIFCGGEPVPMPLLEKNDFLPDFSRLPKAKLKNARLMWLNYPNNPTAAVCSLDFFKQADAFARRHGIIVCHDAAYTELAYDGFRPPSFLELPGAKDYTIEFHSLSKTYNMTGWRIGFAVGNRELIAGLSRVKSNIDSGIFRAVQIAGIAALNGPQGFREGLIRMYRRRRDLLVEGLNSLGWKVSKPKATFYIWAPVPKSFDSSRLAAFLLEKAGIVTTPGVGLGACGEGFIRMTLTRPEGDLAQAVERLRSLGLDWSRA